MKPKRARGRLSYLASVDRCVIKNSLTDHPSSLSCHCSELASRSIILMVSAVFFHHHQPRQRTWGVRKHRPERCHTTINGWLGLSVNRQRVKFHIWGQRSQVRLGLLSGAEVNSETEHTPGDKLQKEKVFWPPHSCSSYKCFCLTIRAL